MFSLMGILKLDIINDSVGLQVFLHGDKGGSLQDCSSVYCLGFIFWFMGPEHRQGTILFRKFLFYYSP